MIDQLRKIAEAATPGRWSLDPGCLCCIKAESRWIIQHAYGGGFCTENDPVFVATFYPDLVKALLNVVETSQQLRSELNSYSTGCSVLSEERVHVLDNAYGSALYKLEEIMVAKK